MLSNCGQCGQPVFKLSTLSTKCNLLFALARFVDKVDNVDNAFLIDSICTYIYSILKIINIKFNSPHCPQIASSFDLIDKKHGQSIHFLLSTNCPHYPHCKTLVGMNFAFMFLAVFSYFALSVNNCFTFSVFRYNQHQQHEKEVKP